MSCIKYLERLKRIDSLIRFRATGKPSELASKLNLSERSVFIYLNDLKLLGAPISWSACEQSYVYTEGTEFGLFFRIRYLTS